MLPRAPCLQPAARGVRRGDGWRRAGGLGGRAGGPVGLDGAARAARAGARWQGPQRLWARAPTSWRATGGKRQAGGGRREAAGGRRRPLHEGERRGGALPPREGRRGATRRRQTRAARGNTAAEHNRHRCRLPPVASPSSLQPLSPSSRTPRTPRRARPTTLFPPAASRRPPAANREPRADARRAWPPPRPKVQVQVPPAAPAHPLKNRLPHLPRAQEGLSLAPRIPSIPSLTNA